MAYQSFFFFEPLQYGIVLSPFDYCILHLIPDLMAIRKAQSPQIRTSIPALDLPPGGGGLTALVLTHATDLRPRPEVPPACNLFSGLISYSVSCISYARLSDHRYWHLSWKRVPLSVLFFEGNDDSHSCISHASYGLSFAWHLVRSRPRIR